MAHRLGARWHAEHGFRCHGSAPHIGSRELASYRAHQAVQGTAGAGRTLKLLIKRYGVVDLWRPGYALLVGALAATAASVAVVRGDRQLGACRTSVPLSFGLVGRAPTVCQAGLVNLAAKVHAAAELLGGPRAPLRMVQAVVSAVATGAAEMDLGDVPRLEAARGFLVDCADTVLVVNEQHCSLLSGRERVVGQ